MEPLVGVPRSKVAGECPGGKAVYDVVTGLNDEVLELGVQVNVVVEN